MSSNTLVVGGTGYVGRSVVDEFRSEGVEVTGTYHSDRSGGIQYDFWEDDLADMGFDDLDTVVFAAHVEGDDHGRTFEDFKAACNRFVRSCTDVRLVYLSSDAVFGGGKGNYTESVPVDPISEYGRRLVTFERAIEEYCVDYCIVRPSYVYGFSRGALDPRLAETRERLQAGDTPRFYDDYYKSPIEVNELAGVLRTLATSDVQGVVHAGGPRTSVYEFHTTAMAALDYPHRRIQAEPMPSNCELPKDTSLDSSRLFDRTGIELSCVAEALQAPR